MIGIVLLYVLLCVHGYARKTEAAERGDVAKAAAALLASLGLVFVPAGVGISQHYGLIFDNGFALIAALGVSTFLTLVVTVGVFRAVSRLRADPQVKSERHEPIRLIRSQDPLQALLWRSTASSRRSLSRRFTAEASEFSRDRLAG